MAIPNLALRFLLELGAVAAVAISAHTLLGDRPADLGVEARARLAGVMR